MDRRVFLKSGFSGGMRCGSNAQLLTLAPEVKSAQSLSMLRSECVDCRFSPRSFQSTICFPDDPVKSIVNHRGELCCEFQQCASCETGWFGSIVEFTLAGMSCDALFRQRLEDAAIPIIHTLIDRPAVVVELTAFATRRKGEGRADNVLMTVRFKGEIVDAVPLLHIGTRLACKMAEKRGRALQVMREGKESSWLYAIA